MPATGQSFAARTLKKREDQHRRDRILAGIRSGLTGAGMLLDFHSLVLDKYKLPSWYRERNALARLYRTTLEDVKMQLEIKCDADGVVRTIEIR